MGDVPVVVFGAIDVVGGYGFRKGMHRDMESINEGSIDENTFCAGVEECFSLGEASTVRE